MLIPKHAPFVTQPADARTPHAHLSLVDSDQNIHIHLITCDLVLFDL